MPTHIEVVVCEPGNPDRAISLFYRPEPTPVADRYLAALRACLTDGFPIKDADRFYNFPNDPRDRPWIIREMQRTIGIVNAWAPGTITIEVTHDIDQPTLNALHLRFEQTRGTVLEPAPLFVRAPPEVRQAIEAYNLLIHRLEDRKRNDAAMRAGRPPIARATLTFADPRPRYPLHEEDYALFRRRPRFGVMAVSYCELGKPVWDALWDQDLTMTDENVRPLRYYSADVVLRFNGTPSLARHLASQVKFAALWATRKGRRLWHQGYRPWDPRNAVGELRVANLDRDVGPIRGMSEAQIVDLVGRHTRFAAVRA